VGQATTSAQQEIQTFFSENEKQQILHMMLEPQVRP